jgi:RNA-binding protein YhbY
VKESLTKATLQIGQSGATESIVAELRAQVKKRQVVKAKRLRSAEVEDEKAFWSELAERAGVRLLEVRGHTAVFADPHYKTERDRRRSG